MIQMNRGGVSEIYIGILRRDRLCACVVAERGRGRENGLDTTTVDLIDTVVVIDQFPTFLFISTFSSTLFFFSLYHQIIYLFSPPCSSLLCLHPFAKNRTPSPQRRYLHNPLTFPYYYPHYTMCLCCLKKKLFKKIQCVCVFLFYVRTSLCIESVYSIRSFQIFCLLLTFHDSLKNYLYCQNV